MKSKLGWILAILLGVILLLLLPWLWMVGRFRFWGMPMMGWSRMMPMHNYPGITHFGWGGMLIGGVVWLGILVLLVLGVVGLVKAFSRPTAPLPLVQVRNCPNCSKTVQADWNNCPFCGTSLSSPDQALPHA